MRNAKKLSLLFVFLSLFPLFFMTSSFIKVNPEIECVNLKLSNTNVIQLSNTLTDSNQYSTNVLWEKGPPLVINDTGHAHIYNGKIYFIGGSAVQEYDPKRGTWAIINSEGLGYNPYRGGSALIGDKIYIVHGWTAEKTSYYDIKNNIFGNFTPANYNRLDVAVAALDGILYVSGGWRSGSSGKTVAAYNLQSDTWYFVEPMGIARKDHEMVAAGGFLYAIGGVLGECPVERYNPIENQWEEIGEGPAYQEFGAVIIQEDNILISGLGEDSTKIFDFTQNKWYQGPIFPEGYGQYGANSLAYLDGYVYSIGARDSPGNYYNFFWKAKSTIPPIIDHPRDKKLTEGSLGPISIVWAPSDNNPAFYNVTRNGELIDEGTWDGGVVFTNVDELPSGNYTFVCTVSDHDGNDATDSVFVEVVPSTVTPSEEISPWGTVIMFISIISLVILFKQRAIKKQ